MGNNHPTIDLDRLKENTNQINRVLDEHKRMLDFIEDITSRVFLPSNSNSNSKSLTINVKCFLEQQVQQVQQKQYKIDVMRNAYGFRMIASVTLTEDDINCPSDIPSQTMMELNTVYQLIYNRPFVKREDV